MTPFQQLAHSRWTLLNAMLWDALRNGHVEMARHLHAKLCEFEATCS